MASHQQNGKQWHLRINQITVRPRTVGGIQRLGSCNATFPIYVGRYNAILATEIPFTKQPERIVEKSNQARINTLFPWNVSSRQPACPRPQSHIHLQQRKLPQETLQLR